MKLSDYLVEFFVDRGLTDFFGFQGTNICHLVDSIARNPRAVNHSCYNEQGASFAACGLSQTSRSPAVAYSTGGPGAANLLSGVANAYFDSLPVIFLTGQINLNEYDTNQKIRQHSFQEIDIVKMAAPVTKSAIKITDATRIRYELERAWHTALDGRPGPVLIDLPMDIQRADIDPNELAGFEPSDVMYADPDTLKTVLEDRLHSARRPVLLVGNGVSPKAFGLLHAFSKRACIPFITSVLARHLMVSDDPQNFGFLGGTYGHREANLIAAVKADLVLSVGISLCSRQIGVKTEQFAPHAQLLRIDIENPALQRVIKQNETYVRMDAEVAAETIARVSTPGYSEWFAVCDDIRSYYHRFEERSVGREPNRLIAELSSWVPANSSISVDVGQHMMWAAQSFLVKEGQRLLFSGGHGAMGYAIPAAIGAWYHDRTPVYCLVGDGGFQMNSQELEWIVRESLPIKIVVLNNSSLGMVRFQQDDLFGGEYEGTAIGYNYSTPDFVAIAEAYGISAQRVDYQVSDLGSYRAWFEDEGPRLLEIRLPDTTAAYPKTFFGDLIYDQRPKIPKEDLDRLLAL